MSLVSSLINCFIGDLSLNVLKISDDTGQIVEYDTKTWQEKPMPIHVKDMLPEVGALVFYYVYTPNVRIREYE